MREEELEARIRAFGSRVRDSRLGLGFTQVELAEVMGISDGHISNIETGAYYRHTATGCLGVQLSLRLAHELGIDVREMFDE